MSSDSAVGVSESHGYFLCFVTVVCYLKLSESDGQHKFLYIPFGPHPVGKVHGFNTSVSFICGIQCNLAWLVGKCHTHFILRHVCKIVKSSY